MVEWNLSDLHGATDVSQELEILSKRAKRLTRWRARLDAISHSQFSRLLKELETLQIDVMHISSYVHLRFSEDTSNTESLALVSKLSQVGASIENDLRFVSLWFKSVSDKRAKELSKGRADVSFYLDSLRELRKYTLSEKEEHVIALKDSAGLSTVMNMYNTVTNDFTYDVKVSGKIQTVTREELSKFVYDPSKSVRKASYVALLGKFGQHRAVLSQAYQAAVLDWRNENMSLRGFKTPIQVRNVHNQLSDKSISVLLKVCQSRKGVFQRYFRKKAKLLKIKNFSRFDIYGQATTSKNSISWPKAINLVNETLHEHSPLMATLARQVISEGHVHSTVKKGKRSGAFCLSPSPKVTPYVLLSYTGELQDVSTLAHELGHAVHGLLASKHSVFTFHPPLPLAETASIFSETLLIRRLLARANQKERQALLIRHIDHLYASIMRQAYFVLFEMEAHEMIAKGASADDLEKAYLANLREQFGTAVDVDELFSHEWLAIPHIFESPFYCYAYAFGNLLSLALVQMLDEQGPTAMAKIERIFAWGGANRPADILKEAGMDIEQARFWNMGFDIVEKLVDDL